ncbi:hypothetical protein Psi01_72820 [Planobispora siamensis]|uniref:Uncharacterized protein n=1 Tax=Planobispora siamensis TaxID=936338 RepID=A0A8J3SLX1_9ACTN|nr:hypothetical protein Psi01_72820 [Planobispora siamensis]
MGARLSDLGGGTRDLANVKIVQTVVHKKYPLIIPISLQEIEGEVYAERRAMSRVLCGLE